MADESTTAGAGPILGVNKAQDAISSLTRTINDLTRGLQGVSSGVGQMSRARGFGLLANDVWNGSSNYGHGRSNGGADAPSTAPTRSRGSRNSGTPNGGGSSFTGGSQGGGGANNGGWGGRGRTNQGRSYGLGGAASTLVSWGQQKLPDQVVMQTTAYQAAQGSASSWQALRNQAFRNNYTAQSTTDAASAYGTLAGQGLSGNTPGFNTQWNYVTGTSGYMNPGMSQAQRAAGSASLWQAGSYNMLRGMGISTIVGGQKQTPRQVAQQIYRQFPQLKNVKNAQQLSSTLDDPASGLNQSINSWGLDPNTVQLVKGELRGMLLAQTHGSSATAYTSVANKADAGSKSALNQLNKWQIGGSTANTLQTRAGTLRNQDVNINDSFTSGLQTATKYLDDFSTALQGVLNATGANSALGFSGGAGSLVGSSLSSGLGAYGAVRGIGALGRLRTARSAASAATAASEGVAVTGTAVAGESAAIAAGPVGWAALAASAAGGTTARTLDKSHSGDLTKSKKSFLDASMADWLFGLHGQKDHTHATKAQKAAELKALGLQWDRSHPSNASGDGNPGGASGGTATGAGGASVATGTQGAGKTASAVISIGKRFLGMPYKWGGNSPQSSFDCSGLTQYIFKQIGVSLPRTAAQQQGVGTEVPLNAVRAGDLMFVGNPAHHVVMCVGNGKCLEAPHTGATVRIRSFSPGEFTNARRILGSVGSMGDQTNSNSDTAGSKSNRLSSMGFGGDTGSYGSTEEVNAIAAGISSIGSASVGSGVGAHQGTTKTTSNGSQAAGAMPSGSLKNWISTALGILHQDTPQNEAFVNTIAMGESGGNPRAQNNWDSNAKAGHPSKGVMQTIDSTFSQWSIAGHKNIWNPVDNIIAGVRYGESRYGSLANIPGVRSVSNGGAYKGYAVGSTNIDVDQTARVHKGEMILPQYQAEAFRKALASNSPIVGGIGGAGAKGGAATLNFHPGAITVQVQGVMDQQSARDAASQFMRALAEDKRINLIASGKS
jgi:cell wall-associated NlpC family hydrolase